LETNKFEIVDERSGEFFWNNDLGMFLLGFPGVPLENIWANVMHTITIDDINLGYNEYNLLTPGSCDKEWNKLGGMHFSFDISIGGKTKPISQTSAHPKKGGDELQIALETVLFLVVIVVSIGLTLGMFGNSLASMLTSGNWKNVFEGNDQKTFYDLFDRDYKSSQINVQLVADHG